MVTQTKKDLPKGLFYANSGKSIKCEVDVLVKGNRVRTSHTMTFDGTEKDKKLVVASLLKWKEKTAEKIKKGLPLEENDQVASRSWTLDEGIQKTYDNRWSVKLADKTASSHLLNAGTVKKLVGGNFQLHHFDDATLIDVVARLKRGEKCQTKNSSGTINRKLSALWGIFHYAHDCGQLGMDVPDVQKFRLNETPSERRALTDEEQIAFIQECHKIDDVDFSTFGDMLEFVMNTGMRQSNVIQMTKDQLRMQGKMPTIVIKAEDFKGKREHTVLLNNRALEIFKKHTQGKLGKAVVFTKKDGSSFTNSSTLHRFNRIKSVLGLRDDTDLVFHSTRNTFITNGFNKGGMIPTDMQIAAGHTDIKTTMKYWKKTEAAYDNLYTKMLKQEEAQKERSEVNPADNLRIVK